MYLARSIIFSIAAFCLVCPANADQTILLVDRSGSMDLTSKELSVRAQISKSLSELPPGLSYSVTEFGGLNGGDCKTPVAISPFQTSTGDIESPTLSTPSKGTPLLGALNAAALAAGEKPTKIEIITDGISSCAEEHICAAVRDFVSTHPSIRVQFSLIEAPGSAEDELSCIATPSSAASVNIVEAGTQTSKTAPLFVLGMLFLSMFVIFAAAVVLLSYETRYRKEVRDAKEGEPVPKGLSSTEIKVLCGCAVIFMACALTIGFGFAEHFSTALLNYWWFFNTPFGSMVAPPLLAGFLGWWLIQAWQGVDARREQHWKNQAKAQQELALAAAKAQQEQALAAANERQREQLENVRQTVSSEKETANDRNVLSIERLELDLDSKLYTATADSFAVVRSIRDRMESMILGINTLDRLRTYSRLRWDSSDRLIQLLADDGLIDKAQAIDMKKLFGDWTRVLMYGRLASMDQINGVLAFDPDELRFKSV